MTETTGIGATVLNTPSPVGAEVMFGESPADECLIWFIDQNGLVTTSGHIESFGYLVEDEEADAESREILDDSETMALIREAEEDVRRGRTIDGDDLRSAP